jgi:hypothetical protein
MKIKIHVPATMQNVLIQQQKTLEIPYVRSEVTMNNAVFWDVMLCGSCKNRHFRRMSVLTRATQRNTTKDGILQFH